MSKDLVTSMQALSNMEKGRLSNDFSCWTPCFHDLYLVFLLAFLISLLLFTVWYLLFGSS